MVGLARPQACCAAKRRPRGVRRRDAAATPLPGPTGFDVEPQFEVFHPSSTLAGRVDMLLRELRLLVEFDGAIQGRPTPPPRADHQGRDPGGAGAGASRGTDRVADVSHRLGRSRPPPAHDRTRHPRQHRTPGRLTDGLTHRSTDSHATTHTGRAGRRTSTRDDATSSSRVGFRRPAGQTRHPPHPHPHTRAPDHPGQPHQQADHQHQGRAAETASTAARTRWVGSRRRRARR